MSKEWALVEGSTWDHLNAVASSEIVLNPQIAIREATCTGLICRSHNWPADSIAPVVQISIAPIVVIWQVHDHVVIVDAMRDAVSHFLMIGFRSSFLFRWGHVVVDVLCVLHWVCWILMQWSNGSKHIGDCVLNSKPMSNNLRILSGSIFFFLDASRCAQSQQAQTLCSPVFVEGHCVLSWKYSQKQAFNSIQCFFCCVCAQCAHGRSSDPPALWGRSLCQHSDQPQPHPHAPM